MARRSIMASRRAAAFLTVSPKSPNKKGDVRYALGDIQRPCARSGSL